MGDETMYIDDIRTVPLVDVYNFYKVLDEYLLSPIQEVNFGNNAEQGIYVGKLIYGLDAERDFTFTKVNGKVLLMDGAKRLNAILRFLDNQLPVGGKWFVDFEQEQLKDISIMITVVGRDL